MQTLTINGRTYGDSGGRDVTQNVVNDPLKKKNTVKTAPFRICSLIKII